MSKSLTQKKATVDLLKELINTHDTIGFANIRGLPAPQLQRMRSTLRETMVLVIAKKTIITLAFKLAKEKPHLTELLEKMTGMPALLFTKDNPFTLSAVITKNKSKAPAKAGQTAPNDIVVPAGPTQFDPGPIISDLGSIGLKTGVENGKVAVKETATVAKDGDVISANVAGVLAKLGIEPMEVGLNLVAVYDKGVIYDKDILSVDASHYHGQLHQAIGDSLALALSIQYVTPETIKSLLQQSFAQARHLALEHNIVSDESVKQWLQRAEQSAISLKNKIPDGPVESPKTEQQDK